MLLRRDTVTDYRRIYRIFVITLLSVLVISQLIIQIMISGGKYDSTIIRVAGQQNMLSEDIAKTVLNIRLNLIQGRDNARNAAQLKQLISQFETNHYSLLLGNDSMGIEAHNSLEILSLFRQIQPDFLAIQISAETIAHQSTFAGGMDDYIDNILTHEPAFLVNMEKIVGDYNGENLVKTRRLQIIEIILALATFVLITLEIVLLFTPLMKHLQERNQALEDQYRRIRHFLFVLSHNIRRPVANLLGLSDLLASDPRKGETVENIHRSAMELDGLIRDLNRDLQGEEGMDAEQEPPN